MLRSFEEGELGDYVLLEGRSTDFPQGQGELLILAVNLNSDYIEGRSELMLLSNCQGSSVIKVITNSAKGKGQKSVLEHLLGVKKLNGDFFDSLSLVLSSFITLDLLMKSMDKVCEAKSELEDRCFLVSSGLLGHEPLFLVYKGRIVDVGIFFEVGSKLLEEKVEHCYLSPGGMANESVIN